MACPDVLIIGGGVIGLSIAHELAAEGASVILLDDDAPGQASHAAAGMLAPLAEARQLGPHAGYGVNSLNLWPAFIEKLRTVAATSLAISGPGMLRLAGNGEELAELHNRIAWQQALGLPLTILDKSELMKLEPNLSSTIAGALLSTSEQYVDPRVLLQALRLACIARGVQIRSREAAIDFETREGVVLGVRSKDVTHTAASYIIAGGAWSRPIALKLGASLPIHPLRGQIVALGPMAEKAFEHTIYTHSGYLVPRCDGRTIVGATEEHADFDARTTPDGITGLSEFASSIIPALSNAPHHSTWAGLRPVSPDGLPLLGRLPAWNNVHVAAGHGRNGILLTPLTAQLMTGHILQGAPLPTAMSPDRFESIQ